MIFSNVLLEKSNTYPVRISNNSSIANFWNQGSVSNLPLFALNSGFTKTSQLQQQLSDYFLEDASFIRLKNLMLSYSFPKKWLDKTRFFSTARLYVQGQNLWTLTKFSGIDPESSSNVYQAQYPMSRQYTLGVELSF